MKRYNPKDIEPKWQQAWQEQGLFQAADFDKKPKYVMLTEFPYPSGEGLHMGHIREYTYGDIISRQKRMQGYNVMYPMGFDAFGLPTENFAIKNKVTPQSATEKNVSAFTAQLKSLGLGFDWSREVKTSDPSYYKWTQWLFLQFFKAGKAYQDEIAINWCPHCKTGLANEEVVNGRHERCDTLVEKKTLKQWLLKITDYADRLIEGLKTVDYPPRIADQQVNWIGRSEGAEILWEVCDQDGKPDGKQFSVFTTRKDTLPGVTFIVVAPESEIIDDLTSDDHRGPVHAYRKQTIAQTDVERQENRKKTGVFTGKYAKNPFNDQVVPIYAADYVLAGYGTGVVMGMPGHDDRDRAFALEHDLPVVLTTAVPKGYEDLTSMDVWTGEGQQINSGEGYDGLSNKEAGQKIFDKMVEADKAKARVTYKLRDWIFSRQHYWGEPIPIIHCPDHGAVAVPDDHLPVELPPVEHYEPTDTGESPLSVIEDWVNVPCPVCTKPARRETDTMPNWAGSSWYYLRYYDPNNDQAFADKEKLDYWGEVDLYLGGMEHTTLHLLYSRFWHQFFYDQGLVPTPEPYAARRGQGIILAADGSKMSKSKGNVVNPTDIIESGYGADALRLAITFLAPYDQTTPWSPESVAGTHRFLQRVWTLAQNYTDSSNQESETDDQVLKATHKLIKKISDDLVNMNFNTAIAAQMEYLNQLYRLSDGGTSFEDQEAWRFAFESLLKLLAPFAPHMCEELWHELGHETSIHIEKWPEYDEKYLVENEVTVVVQINGKLRAEVRVNSGISEEEIVGAAKANHKVAALLAGQTIKKTIYVPDKLVNFVV